MTLDEFSKLFGGLGGLAAAVAVVWGIYAYFEDYQSAVRKDQIEKTLSFVERFGSDRLVKAQEKLTEAWELELKRLNAIKNEEISDEEKLTKFKNLQRKVIEVHGLKKFIWAIVDFYDALWICISANLCDRPTADRFFRGYAIDFANSHWVFINDNREKYGPSFAKGIFRIIGREG
jgi:hypothetical protein